MDVELPDSAVGPKIKADDDPENEAAFMGLSVLRFRMASKKATAEAKKKDWAEFLPLVERFNAVAVYEAVCQETSTAVDGVLLAKMKAANKARLQEIGDCAGEERVCWLEPCEGSEKAGGAHRESVRQEDLERQSLLRNLDGRCDSCANRKARSSATLSARRACCDVVSIILLHAHARTHTYKHTLNQRNVALS